MLDQIDQIRKIRSDRSPFHYIYKSGVDRSLMLYANKSAVSSLDGTANDQLDLSDGESESTN